MPSIELPHGTVRYRQTGPDNSGARFTDAGVRRDVSRFARAADPAELDGVSGRLVAFAGPALLVWGMADRFFKPAFAHRLRDVFADVRLVEIEGGRTFVAHDHPDRLAQEIAAFQVAPVSSL